MNASIMSTLTAENDRVRKRMQTPMSVAAETRTAVLTELRAPALAAKISFF